MFVERRGAFALPFRHLLVPALDVVIADPSICFFARGVEVRLHRAAVLREPTADPVFARAEDRAVRHRRADGKSIADHERMMIDGEERIGDDRATMIAIESYGDGGALVER